jgi:two-component system response regulator HydG
MPSPDAFFLVVRLSDSFADFWPLLAREQGVTATEWSPESGDPAPAGAALVIVAAGGREAELPVLLPQFAPPGDAQLIAVGAAPSHRIAARAVASGAADYFALPEDRDALRETLAAAVQRRRAGLQRAIFAQLEAQAHAFREIVGESPALRDVLNRAARVLPHAGATVLIAGETGTGKELVARALHYGGPRAAAPFVEINCAALPPQLLERAVRHERGAFTDARTAKPGLFEVAEAGRCSWTRCISSPPSTIQTAPGTGGEIGPAPRRDRSPPRGRAESSPPPMQTWSRRFAPGGSARICTTGSTLSP